MASYLWYLGATLCLFATANCFRKSRKCEFELSSLDDRYDKTMEAFVNTLWPSFESNIRTQFNVLFFTVASAMDIDFMVQALDEELKAKVLQSLPLYDNFNVDLEKIEKRLTCDEMRIKTIFVGTYEEMNKRGLIGYASVKLSTLNDRFQLIVYNDTDSVLERSNLLLPKIEETAIGQVCGVRYCAYPTIVGENAPFSTLTLAKWTISSIEFTWLDEIAFAHNETATRHLWSARSFGEYDYREFSYSKDRECTAKVVRIPYKQNFSLVFVAQSDKKTCNSTEEFWKTTQSIDLGGTAYDRKPVDVAIPNFRASSSVDLRQKLKGTAMADVFDMEASKFHDALAFQATEVIFEPQVRGLFEPTAVPADASIFKADRPFIFAIFHKISPEPIFVGLISYPFACEAQCYRGIL